MTAITITNLVFRATGGGRRPAPLGAPACCESHHCRGARRLMADVLRPWLPSFSENRPHPGSSTRNVHRQDAANRPALMQNVIVIIRPRTTRPCRCALEYQVYVSRRHRSCRNAMVLCLLYSITRCKYPFDECRNFTALARPQSAAPCRRQPRDGLPPYGCPCRPVATR
jgi:hypothetical protein